MNRISPFSVRILTLDSALRFAYFSVEEAKKSLQELESSSVNTKEEGKQRAIRLLRSLQSKIMDYSKIRGSFDDKHKERLLIEELRLLSREASIFLSKMKRGAWNLKSAIALLERILWLEEHIGGLVKALEKRTPAPSNFYFGGVDGGATHSKAVISNKNGKIIGEANSGPAEVILFGAVKTFDSLITALKKATENAGLNFKTTYFKRICIGTAGIDTVQYHRSMDALLKSYVHKFYPNIGEATIFQDSLLAWYGALGGQPGLIVIGGTGHIVYGYNDGKDALSTMKGIVRDWKQFIFLGGRHIGYHASLAIAKRLRKRSETILVRSWRSAFKKGVIFSKYRNLPFTKVIDLVKASMYQKAAPLSDKDISGMAKLVFECAQAGDNDAKNIIKEAAGNTSIYISEVAKKIGLHNRPFKVAFIGSVIRHPLAMIHLRENLPDYEPYAQIVKPKFEPQVASIEIARRNLHFY